MSIAEILMAVGALGVVLNITLLMWKINLIETNIKIILGDKNEKK